MARLTTVSRGGGFARLILTLLLVVETHRLHNLHRSSPTAAMAQKKVGDPCTTNKDCDPPNTRLVCANKKCSSGRSGTFIQCDPTTRPCNAAEEKCEDGYCMRPATPTPPTPPKTPPYTDPSVPAGFTPDLKRATGPCEANTHVCLNTNDICVADNCYPRSYVLPRTTMPPPRPAAVARDTTPTTTALPPEDDYTVEHGVRMPPQPGSPNCRDALDEDGESDCDNFSSEMCDDDLYGDLISEQCPKMCGLCDDPYYYDDNYYNDDTTRRRNNNNNAADANDDNDDEAARRRRHDRRRRERLRDDYDDDDDDYDDDYYDDDDDDDDYDDDY